MRHYLEHFKYTLIHKYWVYRACRYLGLSRWTGIIHDLSKFYKIEFGAYARNFFNEDGTRKPVRKPTGGYNPNDQSYEFQLAWMNHQKNKHHWQAWCSIGSKEDGSIDIKYLEIPEKYIREMIADWIAAGIATKSEYGVHKWYEMNSSKIHLNVESRRLLVKILYSLPHNVSELI